MKRKSGSKNGARNGHGGQEEDQEQHVCSCVCISIYLYAVIISGGQVCVSVVYIVVYLLTCLYWRDGIFLVFRVVCHCSATSLWEYS